MDAGGTPKALGDADLPELFRAADETSGSGQRLHLRLISVQLGLLILAGGAGVVHIEAGSVDVGTTVSGCAFVAAALLGAFVLRSRPDLLWYTGRAAAESAKTLAWRYAVGGEPFRIRARGADTADERFLTSLDDVLAEVSEVPLVASDEGEQITPAMRALRIAPLDVRRSVYRDGRLGDQRRWYASKARFNVKRSQTWAMVLLTLEVIGGIAAVLKTTGFSGAPILAVLASAAVAVTSWTETKQHQALASAYGIAAQELAMIRARVDVPETEAEWAAFVDDAEGAISREHTLWRASHGHQGVSREARHATTQ